MTSIMCLASLTSSPLSSQELMDEVQKDSVKFNTLYDELLLMNQVMDIYKAYMDER